MREDQREKLEAMQEEVLDQFLDNGSVADWPDMETPESRGDRYWYIKIKAAEITLLDKISNVLERRKTGRNPNTSEDDSLDKTLRKMEQRVKEMKPEQLAAKYRKPSQARPTH